MLNSNYLNPNCNPPGAKPGMKRLIAIIMGLLTFVITPMVAIVITIPFFFLGQISENFNPIVIIAGFFGLCELGGFFFAQFILLAILALLGDFITAIISWLINKSRKLASITFASALIFQIVAVSIPISPDIKQSQKMVEALNEAENSYREYAKIGAVGYEIQPYSASDRTFNTFPEYGPMGKKLMIIVPVSVDQEGTYRITAQYRVSRGDLSAKTPIKNTVQYLNMGDNIVKVEFQANEARGSYGYWSPAHVGGTVQIQLFYLASEKELLDGIKSNTVLDKMIFDRFLKDEGLDKREAKTKPTVNKFIERKEVQF